MSRTETHVASASGPPPEDDRAFFGQPKGLLTLSGLEVRERFSFLGMQAVLVSRPTTTRLCPSAAGRRANAAPMPAVAVPTPTMTWVGLGLISAGAGLLKPNVAAMVGKPYRTDDDRRDADFALYCMAINIGAFAGPLVTGRLDDHKGWHWGFSAAAIGMTFGLVQYVAGRRHLAGRRHTAEFALAPDSPTLECARAGGPPSRRVIRLIAIGVVLGGLSFLLLVLPTSGHPGDDQLMSAWWIVGSYLLLGLGDILLETSGMSATTKLAPAAFSSQTMSLWYLSFALAGGIQAQTVKLYDDVSKPAYFGVNGAIAVAAGLAVTEAAPWLRRTMHPVH
ncbi:MFS transporter [Streptomyces sp. NPDC001401]|uniref:POT-type proton-dependent oligopeptide transporter n=1 Tax=Streptomyces sp. NPDC001401 TaxID=3364570 RepID=UPI003674D90A